MILMEIKEYLRRHGAATLADIAHHVEADPEAVRGMLEQWVNRGYATKRPVAASCGTTCSHCEPERVEVYEWVSNEAHRRSVDIPCPENHGKVVP